MRGGAVRAVCLRAKTVKRGQLFGNGEFEDHSPIVCPSKCRSPIEVPVTGLQQPGIRIRAVGALKTVHRLQFAFGRDPEYRAVGVGSASGRCPVEAPVLSLDQPGERRDAVRAVATSLGAKVVKRRQFPVGCDSKNCATSDLFFASRLADVRTAGAGGPVEIPVLSFYQHAPRIGPVRAVCLGAELMQCRELSCRADLEDSSADVSPTPIPSGCAVEISVRSSSQPRVRSESIAAVEAVQHAQRSRRRELENGAGTRGPARLRGSIEIAVWSSQQPRVRTASVSAAGLRAEVVNRFELALRVDSEYCASVISSARIGRPKEIAIRGLQQPGVWCRAVSATRLRAKAVKRAESLRLRESRQRKNAQECQDVEFIGHMNSS